MSDGVAPLDDAVHDVAGVVLLVGAESLRGKKGRTQKKAKQTTVMQRLSLITTNGVVWEGRLRTGLMSLLREPMKSALVTCSFSARSMSTSTVDVACRARMKKHAREKTFGKIASHRFHFLSRRGRLMEKELIRTTLKTHTHSIQFTGGEFQRANRFFFLGVKKFLCTFTLNNTQKFVQLLDSVCVSTDIVLQ